LELWDEKNRMVSLWPNLLCNYSTRAVQKKTKKQIVLCKYLIKAFLDLITYVTSLGTLSSLPRPALS